VLSLIEVENDEDALRQAARCPYALGATIFGASHAARDLAGRVQAGVVIVNDMIAPTADPRVPFGGRGESGYGVTRGAEGLLGLTAAKTVIVKRGRSRRHLDVLRGGEDRLLLAWLRTTHAGSWRRRFRAALDLVKEGRRYVRETSDKEGSRDEPHA
jgi:hypothetical protein